MKKDYQWRLNLFLVFADKYGLQIIKPKFIPNDSSRDWAKDLLN